MKKVVFLLFMGLISLTSFAQDKNAKQDKKAKEVTMKFDQKEIDYGIVEQGGDGVREFAFTNVSDAPLIINRVKSSCGCTVPQWPKEPIAPGAEASIKVKYNTARIGSIRKSITVFSNAKEGTVILRIKGKVVAKEAVSLEKKDSPVRQ